MQGAGKVCERGRSYVGQSFHILLVFLGNKHSFFFFFNNISESHIIRRKNVDLLSGAAGSPLL